MLFNQEDSSKYTKNVRKLNTASIGEILKQSELNQDPDNITNNIEYIKNTLKYEKRINDLKNEICNIKANELKRINTEFLYNDFERRFLVNKEKVVSAIVGIENLRLEMSKLNKYQKVCYHISY